MIDPDEQLRRDRERESKEAMDSLQKSDEDLLKEIFICSNDHLAHNQSTRISRSLAYFSSLLIKLSRQAEESTKRIVKLTKILTYLTWAIAILTTILVLVTFFEFPKKTIFSNQETNQTYQKTKQNQADKPNENHK
ncbi:MAG: hypothetical protein A2073_03080 [Deltaproteobacteria bacterium GWC2_42_11]|nr:MAG: hypothetical protein A2073_03080 [Deltaproteobacteria bacterium GWC2_42_11]HBO83782.1 hypothetical protein [Deltaproteobacteria bacterium]